MYVRLCTDCCCLFWSPSPLFWVSSLHLVVNIVTAALETSHALNLDQRVSYACLLVLLARGVAIDYNLKVLEEVFPLLTT